MPRVPYRSTSQHHKFRAMESRGELPKGTASEWAHHTPNLKSLPKHVKKPKKRKKGRAAMYKAALDEMVSEWHRPESAPPPAGTPVDGLGKPLGAPERPIMRFPRPEDMPDAQGLGDAPAAGGHEFNLDPRMLAAILPLLAGVHGGVSGAGYGAIAGAGAGAERGHMMAGVGRGLVRGGMTGAGAGVGGGIGASLGGAAGGAMGGPIGGLAGAGIGGLAGAGLGGMAGWRGSGALLGKPKREPHDEEKVAMYKAAIHEVERQIDSTCPYPTGKVSETIDAHPGTTRPYGRHGFKDHLTGRFGRQKIANPQVLQQLQQYLQSQGPPPPQMPQAPAAAGNPNPTHGMAGTLGSPVLAGKLGGGPGTTGLSTPWNAGSGVKVAAN